MAEQPVNTIKDPKNPLKNLTLTPKQIEQLFFTPCKTKAHLDNWIKFFLEMDLPETIVSRYSNCSPLDFVWEMYDIVVNKNNPNDIKEVISMCARGSGKTLGVAIIEFLAILHDHRCVAHVGAILAQAKRAYEYIERFINIPKVNAIMMNKEKPIIIKQNMERSTFDFGTARSTFEIIPCTIRAANGLHPDFLSVDELDTLPKDGYKAFQDLQGALDTRCNKAALRINISTRKTRFGLMEQQVSNAEKMGKAIRKWTSLEFHTKCPDSKSGRTPAEYYVLQEDLILIEPEEWEVLPQNKKQNYIKYKMYTGCKTCPIAGVCLGDAKRQTSQSKMLKPIDELIQKVRAEGADWCIAQLFNLKPSAQGVIFKEFDRKKHVHNWNSMWTLLTGEEYPGKCTMNAFVKKCHQLDIPCYCGIDWGWSSPSAAVYFFVTPNENIFVVKSFGLTYTSNAQFVSIINQRFHRLFRVQLYCPDVALPGEIKEMTKIGLPCNSIMKKNPIENGIQLIKKYLLPPGLSEGKMFFNDEECAEIIEEMNMYHFKTGTDGKPTAIPDDEFNHFIDAFRYALEMAMNSSNFNFSADSSRFENRSLGAEHPLSILDELMPNYVNNLDQYRRHMLQQEDISLSDEAPVGGFVFEF